ncbi:MAG: hypothetical protein M3297_11665 [Thermoproteota archaeon]|nr:hypothetical protein [Thermoproteota archaeon]
MSLEDQLEEQAHKLIDAALENIPHDYLIMGTGPNVRSVRDFVYGYEYGCIVTGLADYYRFRLPGGRDITVEEVKYMTSRIQDIVRDRLSEIRQTITRVETNLNDDQVT